MAKAIPAGGISYADEVEFHSDFTADITVGGATSPAGSQRGMLVNVSAAAGGTLAFITRTSDGTIVSWALPQGSHFLPIQIRTINAAGTSDIASVLALL